MRLDQVFNRDVIRTLAAILLATLTLMIGVMWGQATPAQLAFEVAAIRPAELPSPQDFRGGGGPPQLRTGMLLDAGRLDWGLHLCPI